jgi:hypothetical protein
MTGKGAAKAQHDPGAARTEETVTGAEIAERSGPSKTDSVEPAQQHHERGVPEGLKDGPEAYISAARAAWLEMIGALARAAAQQDHDAALRKTQGSAYKTGEQE